MEAPISHSVYRRSGGDHFPPRRHASPPNFSPSVAVVKSLAATIQNQVLRNGGATLHRPLKSSLHRKPSLSVRMSLREDTPSLATVGVSSTVGQESIYDRSCRAFEMLASELSDGIHITFEDNDEELTQECCNGVDIALFSAGSSISKKFGPIVGDSELIFVDNSSAFRMDENLPLVIPEMNPKATALIKLGSGKGALISNPNYSTITCLMAATPLHRHGKVLRMFVSTYQASSGAGAAAAAMEELEQQIREVLKGKQPTCNIFKQQNDMNVKVTATCIRVPVMRAHAESINLKFEMPIDEDAARDILRNAPGVVVIYDRAVNHFPTPLEVSNKDVVAVGRIRSDVSQDRNYGLDIFVCGDQIRKGAALNAVQIVEML